MQHTTLSAVQVSTLCGVDERTVERWIEEGQHFFGALRACATDQDRWRVPRAYVEQFLVDRDQSSDPTALIVVFSPTPGNSKTASTEMQVQIYEVDPDTLRTLQHRFDLGGEPVPAFDDLPTFGDRLERLFALVTQPDGTPFTGKSQKAPSLAVGMNGKAGDVGAAAPKGFSLRKPRRKAPGSFTNEEIAQRAGLTDGTYVWKLRNKKWRAQDPKLSTIAALARAFGVSPMHFFVHSDVYALLAKNRQSEEG